MQDEPTFHLEGVLRNREELGDFEGPLNLILMLLSKNKIEIRDIQISEILEQYLEYLDRMKAMDLEIASEFVQMAAHLLYIKTRMLLTGDEEAADELELLMRSLEQLKARDSYLAIKETLPELNRRAIQGMQVITKLPEPLPAEREYRYRHETWELLSALATALRRAPAAEEETEEQRARQRRSLLPKRIVYPVREKSRELLLRLSTEEAVSLSRLYRESESRSEIVATFLSILELCSLGHTRMVRDEDEEIVVRFCGGDMEEILASIQE
ncbi:MAG: segregation/condensation protein A [Oscillospiraceae bacterium]|nr:segregation/condensation protein A [Oscillospiraceae bacterium]